MFVVSCSGLLKKKQDAGAVDAAEPEVLADAAPAPTPAAIAANEGDVARFPDETKLADVSATTLRGYNVREAPPNGELVTTLGKGTSVTQIAQRDRYFLVVFDSPKAPGTKLMGWIDRDAFSAVIQDAGPLVCPKGEIALFGDTPFCGKLCGGDADCPTGQACKGSAAKLMKGKPGDSVTVCTVYHPHDAGVHATDASTPATDGGGGAKFHRIDAGSVTDAGGPAPTPSPAKDVVPATGGTCPGNFVLVAKTGQCHRPCPKGPTGGECKSFCIKCDKDEKKVCADSREQCR
jgi:hypothetical protein